MSRSDLVRRILAALGIYLSTIILIASLSDDGFAGWQVFLAVVVVALALVDFTLLIRDYLRLRLLVFEGDRAIRDYMFRWIQHGGHVQVFSRDLSWVADDEMKTMLKQKAENDELTIVLPQEIPLSRKLHDAGATVIYYPALNRRLRSRFTIANSGRSDSTVAVGWTVGTSHYVRQYSAATSEPGFYLAEDLAGVLSAYGSSPTPPAPIT